MRSTNIRGYTVYMCSDRAIYIYVYSDNVLMGVGCVLCLWVTDSGPGLP